VLRVAQNKKPGEARVQPLPRQIEMKNPAVMPWVTVPLNLLETGGAHSTAFDFQLRPVGHPQSTSPVIGLLRFKDLVSKHEHGRVKSLQIRVPKITRSLAACLKRSPGEVSPIKHFFSSENWISLSFHMWIALLVSVCHLAGALL